jgi:uncharacterized protein
MSIDRRTFIKASAFIALGFTGLSKLASCGFPRVDNIPYGYGPLIKDKNKIFDLPEGFSYKIISRTGDQMTDGLLVPASPDGMAAFQGTGNNTIVLRNHEINSGVSYSYGPFGKNNVLLKNIPSEKIYDYGMNNIPSLGGTTSIVYNTKTQSIEKQFLSLIGTLRNCAGGPTPWNSWLTCEETVQIKNDFLAKDHGYIFEVPATEDINLAEPLPLKAMGRFNHEAVAVDPETGIVYQTEDLHDGLIYRFIPDNPGELISGGKLQALVVKDMPGVDTRNWNNTEMIKGRNYIVEWIDLEDVDSPEDDLRYRGHNKGAALFARGEGMWYGNGKVYFVCTSGGRNKKGQVWSYTPLSENLGILNLFVEPNDSNLLDMGDNITVAPWGDLIICEDGTAEQYLVGITPEGKIYKFGRNAISDSELAGSCFSPDGSTLFFNIQKEGLTLAVTGTWKKEKLL